MSRETLPRRVIRRRGEHLDSAAGQKVWRLYMLK